MDTQSEVKGEPCRNENDNYAIVDKWIPDRTQSLRRPQRGFRSLPGLGTSHAKTVVKSPSFCLRVFLRFSPHRGLVDSTRPVVRSGEGRSRVLGCSDNGRGSDWVVHSSTGVVHPCSGVVTQ